MSFNLSRYSSRCHRTDNFNYGTARTFRERAIFRNVFWKLQQTGTDKELIHPTQFVDCPLLQKEDCFLLLSPSKSLKPLCSILLAATDTPHLASKSIKPLHNHNHLPAQAVPFSKKKRFTVKL